MSRNTPETTKLRHASAARARVVLDRALGYETPQHIKDLSAEYDPAS